MDQAGKCVQNSQVEFDSFEVIDDLEEFVVMGRALCWVGVLLGLLLFEGGKV
jgi:hypothetical protein